MELPEDVKKVVEAHRVELEGDLDLVRHDLARARTKSADLERQVVVLEALLGAESEAARSSASGLTLHDAMAAVLRDAPASMMRAADLAAEINRRGLYRMRDGRPVETQQIHARVTHYPHLLAKSGTFITLALEEPPVGTGVAEGLAPAAGGVDPRSHFVREGG